MKATERERDCVFDFIGWGVDGERIIKSED